MLRLGVVGCGLVAQAIHLPYLSELRGRFALAGLAEPVAAVRESVAARYGVPLACADHAELLERGRLDAVLVCSPNATHAEVVLDALAAGVHVLVEKPLCLSEEEADRIIAARDGAGLVVQVGYMKRFDPGYEALLDDLPRADDLLHVATTTYDPGMLAQAFAPADMPAPAAAAAEPDVLSEVFLGALVHDVNAVHGILERLGIDGPHTVTDAFARGDGAVAGGVVALPGGARWTMVWLRLDGLGDFAERIDLYAADGVRSLRFPAPYLRQAPTAYRRSTGRAGANEARQLTSWREAYARQLVHFHDCVTAARACRTPPEQAREDIALLTALHRASLAAAAA